MYSAVEKALDVQTMLPQMEAHHINNVYHRVGEVVHTGYVAAAGGKVEKGFVYVHGDSGTYHSPHFTPAERRGQIELGTYDGQSIEEEGHKCWVIMYIDPLSVQNTPR